ncbi:hypothetical protein J6TS1_20900 [Siminovitchia terrae]|uniref:Uncharacterized protein n=1 Tax=Siminovitchia terrae TaxID=1914933 RepID=A0ABQ4KW16_SIMTE|nr:hypothetical protein [Siminovitchia terrae]GIN96220.1 hypothetical protein J6TS1_20900 [Siminovitchia terrae]
MKVILKSLSYSISFFIVLILSDYFRSDDWQWKDNLLEAVFWGIFVPSMKWLFKGPQTGDRERSHL